ncbi:hypothetical protein IW262DRAFT_1417865, partial [Armillaria fumosa]
MVAVCLTYCVLSGLYFFLFTFCEGREGRHQEQKIGFAVDFGELRNWFCRLGQRRLLCAISEIHCLACILIFHGRILGRMPMLVPDGRPSGSLSATAMRNVRLCAFTIRLLEV